MRKSKTSEKKIDHAIMHDNTILIVHSTHYTINRGATHVSTGH